MYKRYLTDDIIKRSSSGKAIVIVGPRQVGKTTLIKELLSNEEYLFIDMDDPTTRSLMTNPNIEQLKNILGNKKVIFIDEAQRLKGIGLTLKLITDRFKDVKLFVSGSSSFELSTELNEPLTGRKWQYELFPISWEEYEEKEGFLKSEQSLENRLLYGFYPDVLNNPGDEHLILHQLVDSYLYRDILAYANIRKPEYLSKLAMALAAQIGSEVNYNELAQTTGLDTKTVMNYVDILEKAYIIFRLPSYSNNLRNEIKKNRKIYFYDVGVRNSILGDFRDISIREDKGALWENFLVAERVKLLTYKHPLRKYYFWRTKQQQEVDFVEVDNTVVSGYEFKWKKKGNVKLPKTFTDKYSAETFIIDRENFREFVKQKI